VVVAVVTNKLDPSAWLAIEVARRRSRDRRLKAQRAEIRRLQAKVDELRRIVEVDRPRSHFNANGTEKARRTEANARWKAEQLTALDGAPMQAYQCLGCGSWHVGHATKTVQP
jgi:hypothetical protein